MKVDISIICCMCGASFEISEELPHGWSHRYGALDDELAFCADHAAIADWADSQCPGCVGGWTDCNLWKDFAYSSLNLTKEDFASIEAGICPKRTNGSFVLSGGVFSEADLSEKAPAESGLALSKAIGEYAEKYHKR